MILSKSNSKPCGHIFTFSKNRTAWVYLEGYGNMYFFVCLCAVVVRVTWEYYICLFQWSQRWRLVWSTHSLSASYLVKYLINHASKKDLQRRTYFIRKIIVFNKNFFIYKSFSVKENISTHCFFMLSGVRWPQNKIFT